MPSRESDWPKKISRIFIHMVLWKNTGLNPGDLVEVTKDYFSIDLYDEPVSFSFLKERKRVFTVYLGEIGLILEIKKLGSLCEAYVLFGSKAGWTPISPFLTKPEDLRS